MPTPPPRDLHPRGNVATTDPSSSPAPRAEGLSLGQFIDLRHLLEMQRSFALATGLRITLLDADGQPLAVPPAPLDSPLDDPAHIPLIDQSEISEEGPFIAPILVGGRKLGSVFIESPQSLEEQGPKPLNRAEAMRFLNLWANSITRFCHRGYQLQQKVEQLSALYQISTLLSAHRDLQQVLDTAARCAAEVMKAKAASIRLLDDSGRELHVRAAHNLSQDYLNKGSIPVERSELYQRSLAGEVVYVEDMANDPRVLYPELAQREGIVSILSAPMIYRQRPIGVIRLYTDAKRWFSPSETDLLQAVAQLLASAIENARLNAENVESEQVRRQLLLAADVQRRMMPASVPNLPAFDFAARYVPSLELGGDFYDFINLDGHLGIAVGDVVGKGVAAGLLMASVRAALRAYAQDVYDLDEIISRVNLTMSRETLDNEFATLFYCVIDPSTRRLTYCNAGHEPPLLLRDGAIQRLEAGGMIVGIDPAQSYEKDIVDLRAGDLLVIYTDGLSDAQNFHHERFGRERIIQAMRQVAGACAQDALNHLLWEMRRFVGLNRSVDDTTLVVIKVRNPVATGKKR